MVGGKKNMAKILLVEDDPDLSDLLVDSLENEWHTIERALDGEEALHLLRYAHYELLILDWGLPGLTGNEMLKQYRHLGGTAGVIMLTARNTMNDKVTCFDAGANDYITKPFEIRDLVWRVRGLLRRPVAVPAKLLVH